MDSSELWLYFTVYTPPLAEQLQERICKVNLRERVVNVPSSLYIQIHLFVVYGLKAVNDPQ